MSLKLCNNLITSPKLTKKYSLFSVLLSNIVFELTFGWNLLTYFDTTVREGSFFMTSQRCPPFNSREAYITHYISTFYFPTFVVSWSFHDIQCKVTTYRMSMSLSDATVLILDLMHLIWYKCIQMFWFFYCFAGK